MLSSGNTTQNLTFDLLAPCHGSAAPQRAEPMLTFDDILGIAQEYERTQEAMHISASQGLQAGSVVSLKHILAAILPTEGRGRDPEDRRCGLDRGEESEQLLTTPAPTETCKSPWLEALGASQPHPHLHSRQIHEGETSTRTHASPGISENKSTPTLLGWTPPNGSQALDLEPNLELPDLDAWYPPWLAKLLAPSVPDQYRHPEVHSSSPTPSVIGGAQPNNPVGEMSAPPTRSGKVVEKDGRSIPPPPAQLPPTRAVLASIQQTASRGNENFLSQTSAKSSRSRPRPSSAAGATTAGTRTYANAPRGGIPPHLARTVTKANILRTEQERERMRAAASGGSVGEGRKPSVLATVGKVQPRGVRDSSAGVAKKVFDWGGDGDGEGGRVPKRMKV
ncbi:hypothetical protein BDN67DRAFT_974363 [Paxillus ammoniavirescens]|nr:hypothetical protein BDN67DRAFT_974363 [Paxillus ammoniavirescens]